MSTRVPLQAIRVPVISAGAGVVVLADLRRKVTPKAPVITVVFGVDVSAVLVVAARSS